MELYSLFVNSMYYCYRRGYFIVKKTLYIIFVLMIFIYGIGVFAGAVREVKVPNQEEIYEYLEKSVSSYEMDIQGSMKSVAMDSIKSMAILAVAGLFRPVFWLIAVVMLMKGYMAGFSVMAALRLYGIKGSLLCTANFISAAISVPAISCYGSVIFNEMFVEKLPQKELVKKTTIILILLLAILCVDCLAKGFLLPIFLKYMKSSV